MGSVNSAVIPLLDEYGQAAAHLEISLLPTRRESIPAPLIDERSELARSEDLEPVQLLESYEYRYRLTKYVPTDSHWMEPAEMFEPDDDAGLTGRLRPGLATGRVEIALRAAERTFARSAVEVRSRKLDYIKHYRWMLRDISEIASELIMERFAAAEQRFSIDDQSDARTLYQQFQFLQSGLASDIDTALRLVLAKPYVSWNEEEQAVDPRRGVRMSSQVQREWVRPGPRLLTQTGYAFESIPARLRAPRTEATYDNIPNRFVKFALERWRDIAVRVDSVLAQAGSAAPVVRGRREAQALASHLENALDSALFKEIGNLDRFPAGNQVLYKREGYREIFRAYIQSELAAKLAWAGGDSVYSAGQRDVATLYEYWVFFQVARIVSSLCSTPLDLASLIETRPGGLNLSLTRDRAVRFVGHMEHLGRRLSLELWFNRTFAARGAHQSWTRSMRPDVALLISAPPGDSTFDAVWLHFDAKYRIDALEEIMGPPSDGEESATINDSDDTYGTRAGARRTDLLKMHAYKDAIHRSAGAYVLYPGTETEVRHEYHEVLPGVGAFVLRPSERGEAEGTAALSQFVADVVDHLSSQLSQHERGRFWRRVAFSDEPTSSHRTTASWLHRPPADTSVLLGYVKNSAHASWIHRTALYNLRADADSRPGVVGVDSRELAADVLVLYGPGVREPETWIVAGATRLLSKEDLLRGGYPRPGGNAYFCILLDRNVTEIGGRISMSSVTRVRSTLAPTARLGEPILVTWLDLVAQA